MKNAFHKYMDDAKKEIQGIFLSSNNWIELSNINAKMRDKNSEYEVHSDFYESSI